MMFICRNSPWAVASVHNAFKFSAEVLAVLARDQLVSHLLAFVQGGQAGLLPPNMHEKRPSTIVC